MLCKEMGLGRDEVLDLPIGQVRTFQHAIFNAANLETRFLTDNDERQEHLAAFDDLLSSYERYEN